jgi:hypothetical protein
LKLFQRAASIIRPAGQNPILKSTILAYTSCAHTFLISGEKVMRYLLATIASISLLMNVATGFAQACHETSEDGRLIVGVCADAHADSSRSTDGAGVPFGAIPDWQNAIRRQVGGIQIADINGDGLNDLIAGCFNSNSFPPYDDWRTFIHLNTGNSLETTPSWYSTDQVHTGDIQLADFNLDGNLDILAVNGGFAHAASVIYFGNASPALPNPAPGWQTSGINAWALAAAAFDFDHDGDPDILTTNQSGITNDNFRPLYFFRNNTINNGTFPTSPAWQSADQMISNGVDVGDVDGDGWEDIATAKWVNFQCAIYKNNFATPGAFFSNLPAWSNGITEGGRGAGFNDYDGDGDLDVVYGLDPTRLYRNDTPQGVGAPLAFTLIWSSTAPFPSVQELRWHDVDADGDLDLAEINFSTGRCHIYLNNAGSFDTLPTWTYDAPIVGNTLAFGDINGDGCDDLAIGYSGEPSIVVFYAACDKGPACPADITGDNTVGVADLLAVINQWGACPAPPTTCAADIAPQGGDGSVNVADLLAVINGWGACR